MVDKVYKKELPELRKALEKLRDSRKYNKSNAGENHSPGWRGGGVVTRPPAVNPFDQKGSSERILVCKGLTQISGFDSHPLLFLR